MPDTMNYLMLGLATGLGIIGFYIVSLRVRFGNAAKTLRVMDELQD